MIPPQFPDRLTSGQPQKFVFFGTSLTEGGTWNRHLTERLNEKFPGLISSVNTAKGGETSVWGLANFSDRVLAHRPDVLFMEFTINDAVARFEISLEESARNLIAMRDRLSDELPSCEVILQIMNPVIDRPAGHTGHRGKLATYCDQWRAIAAERGLALIDHWPNWSSLLESNEPEFRRLVPDGLHPEDEGYRRIVMPELLRACRLDN
jgi:acyl-CoA thioesterase-1